MTQAPPIPPAVVPVGLPHPAPATAPAAPVVPAAPAVLAAPAPAAPVVPQAPIAATPESPAMQPAQGQAGHVPAQQPSAPTTEQLIDAYVQLRDSADAIKARHKIELQEHNDLMDKITKELDTRLAVADAKTISADSGSVTRVITTNAVCNDWSAFGSWVTAMGRWDVFPKKLNYTPFKEMVENDEALPPGVRLERSARVQVRRKTQ